MPDQSRKEAAELASRAAMQGKHAAKNSARAARAATEPIVENVVDTAEGVAETVTDNVTPLRPEGIRFEVNDLGKAWISSGIAVAAATYSYARFKKVWKGSRVIATRGRKVG